MTALIEYLIVVKKKKKCLGYNHVPIFMEFNMNTKLKNRGLSSLDVTDEMRKDAVRIRFIYRRRYSGDLNKWETDFIINLYSIWKKNKTPIRLSEKQSDILKKIYNRIINPDTYSIVRYHKHRDNRVIKKGLTLEQAQAHCQREDTHGDQWFDGYRAEKSNSLIKNLKRYGRN